MEFVDRAFARLAAVEGRFLAMAFFGGLLIYTLALLSQAIAYSEAARLFPIVVGVPLVVMLVVQILLLGFDQRFSLGLSGIFDSVGGIDLASAKTELPKATRYRREFAMVLWVTVFVLLTWLLGTLLALYVFLFAFVYVHERTFVRAFSVSTLTFGFVYVLFVRLLGATLWRGVMPLGGVLP